MITKYLIVFLISMVPLIELRGAIPYAVAFHIPTLPALLLFVGIPLPGTGAWTGTLAASILDMDFKTSVLAVMGGVLLASVIMLLASSGVFGAIGALLA